MTQDKRFEVELTVVVREKKGDSDVPFFDNTLRYHDMPYDGVVAFENQLIGVLQSLNDMGITQALALGLGERLSAMGLGEKVESLSVRLPQS